jgi:hypothetical protein
VLLNWKSTIFCCIWGWKSIGFGLLVLGFWLLVFGTDKIFSMLKTHFENIQIYQLAEKLSDEVWAIVIGWEPFARNTIGAQLVRSTDSIGANIAEVVGVEPTRITSGS